MRAEIIPIEPDADNAAEGRYGKTNKDKAEPLGFVKLNQKNNNK